MLPIIRGKDLVIFPEKLGFVIIRQKGSHLRMKSEGGKDAAGRTDESHGDENGDVHLSEVPDPSQLRKDCKRVFFAIPARASSVSQKRKAVSAR